MKIPFDTFKKMIVDSLPEQQDADEHNLYTVEDTQPILDAKDYDELAIALGDIGFDCIDGTHFMLEVAVDFPRE